MVICVILTPFPFYKNIIFFPGWYCSYKSGALFAKFQPDALNPRVLICGCLLYCLHSEHKTWSRGIIEKYLKSWNLNIVCSIFLGGGSSQKMTAIRGGPREKIGKLRGGHAIFKWCFPNPTSPPSRIKNERSLIPYLKGKWKYNFPILGFQNRH